jgi:hypothetical protein
MPAFEDMVAVINESDVTELAADDMRQIFRSGLANLAQRLQALENKAQADTPPSHPYPSDK